MRTLLATALCSFMLAAPLHASTLLVGNKTDNTVDLVDPSTGKSRATLPTGKGPHEIVASPDGKTAVVSNYGTGPDPGSSLTVIDVAAAKVLRTITLGRHSRPHGMAWLSGDRIAVTTEGSQHLLVVDVKGGTIVEAVPTGQNVSHMVAVTPQGRAFVANIGSGSATVVDLQKKSKLGDVVTGKGAEGVAVAPGGAEVWVTNREADTLSVIDPKTLGVKATIACAGFPIRIAFTPDGKHVLVSAASSGEVVRFDAAKRVEVQRAKLDLQNAPDAAKRLFGDRFGKSPVPVGLLITPDGKTAYVAATQSDAVVAIDTLTLAIKGVVKAGREPDGMAWAK